ncbi:hypothetical protein Tco_0673317, partial [Tanacetum coccineum]
GGRRLGGWGGDWVAVWLMARFQWHGVAGDSLRLESERSKMEREINNKPSLVLDDSCILQRDFSLSLMGKVLDFGSLSSMKMILAKEGFDKLTLKYMGGFWILIEFWSKSVLEKFKSHVGVGSWFSVLQYASNSFMIDERVAWLDIEGVPLKA